MGMKPRKGKTRIEKALVKRGYSRAQSELYGPKLTASAKDLTKLGLVVGEWIFIEEELAQRFVAGEIEWPWYLAEPIDIIEPEKP